MPLGRINPILHRADFAAAKRGADFRLFMIFLRFRSTSYRYAKGIPTK
jgi:hypothetical protein